MQAGIPYRVVAAGRKLWPLLRKAPDALAVFSAKAKGITRGGMVAKRVQPASPASPDVSRQVRRQMEREFAKSPGPLKRARRRGAL